MKCGVKYGGKFGLKFKMWGEVWGDKMSADKMWCIRCGVKLFWCHFRLLRLFKRSFDDIYFFFFGNIFIFIPGNI